MMMMMMDNYILNKDGSVAVENDILKWGAWFDEACKTGLRRIGATRLNGHYISTVFLGLDHNFSRGDPLLFETMIFKKGSWEDEYMRRYATKEAARRGHERAKHKVSLLGRKKRRKVNYKVPLTGPIVAYRVGAC